MTWSTPTSLIVSKRLTLLFVFLVLTIVYVVAQGRVAPLREFPEPIIVSPQVNVPLANTYGNAVAISPDGRNIAYNVVRDGEQMLYLYSLTEKRGRLVTGSEGASANPFFSSDSRSLAFSAFGKLRKVLLTGGLPTILNRTPSFWGGSWEEGVILFGGNLNPLTLGLHRVSSDGGTPKNLIPADPEQGENAFAFPETFPGGKAILFSVLGRENWRTEILLLETGDRKVVLEEARQAHYLSPGYLVYEKSGTGVIMAVPFDLTTLDLTGNPVSILDGVRQSPSAAVDYNVSSEGTLVYVPRPQYDQELVWVDRTGAETPILHKRRSFETPRLSPDGTRVAFTLFEDNRHNVWVYELENTYLQRLTDGELNSTQIWTPDGKEIIFQSRQGGSNGLYRRAADGSGPVQAVTVPTRMPQIPGAFTPDGRVLTYRNRGTIWAFSMAGDKEPRKLVNTPAFECCSDFSPDGRWFTWVDYTTGQGQVYVDTYPEPGVKLLVSGPEGGEQPVWSPVGGEIFYRTANKMMSVTIQTEPTVRAGKPQVLFEGSYVSNPHISGVPYYDVSPDGERFLMIKDDTEPDQIYVVPDWVEELKRLVPTH